MHPRTGLPVVGMVGAGQLARMTHQAAIALGQSLRVLAADPDDGAALVAADVLIGDHTDLAALRKLAASAEVVTFDHEHVPPEHLRALVAEGVTVYPGPDALIHAQDKQVMRERLTALGAPAPRWAPVGSVEDVVRFAAAGQASATGGGAAAAGAGRTVVAKATRGGYDGRGVWMISDPSQVRELLDAGTSLIVEERVPLVRELAAVVARSPFGQVAAWPVVETVQRDGINVEVIAPAPGLSEERAIEAQELAIRIAAELGVVGVLAVELFETPNGILVNELAMRPHNSAHWTIEGSRTSQFEQHLRAVLDYPLGATNLTAPYVVMANLLGGDVTPPRPGTYPRSDTHHRPPAEMTLDERLHHMMAAEPGVKVHLYGKELRPGRKVGHVTALGDDLDDVRRRARRAVHWLREGQETS
ncbi:5-(carboxyamino)imidazole ribonucleotide synthase [Cryptosporangium aurantiacum]|uniref:N5-carboxyaminoimidazole ribonucleotide synthase n=1 Tax=Cryptosporangium aurantiacum TaxID=134849 RepID=A0A1M7QUQ0_9ACTN|nr:5-(carboxyamino)imidazole ribonucleotide synthase [Cryptosporangium aurantiacum]SHN35618.1 5-(carboxyamino)imidazole ribonucleotide synthase [Cryptosporangium aurantiacum]